MNHIDLLTAEIFERAVRIYGLVQRAIKPLMLGTKKVTAQIASGNKIKSLVEDLIVGKLKGIYFSQESDDEKVEQLRALMEIVAIIHEGALPTIPRIVEPIELHSYLRQGFRAQTVDQFLMPDILVFAAERLGMQIYPNSLVSVLEGLAERQMLAARARHFSGDISKLAELTLSNTKIVQSTSDIETSAYVAIPAIDIHNPTRWPSLWHELGHHQLKNQTIDVLNDFKKHIGGDHDDGVAYSNLCRSVYAKAIIGSCSDENSNLGIAEDAGSQLILNWLVECWCDAYGVRQAGLAFLYAQLHDFMFCWPNYLAQPFLLNQPYPSAKFRLRLSQNLAIERLKHQKNRPPNELMNKLVEAYRKEESIFLNLTKKDENDVIEMADLYSHFLSFFKNHPALKIEQSVIGQVSGDAFQELEDDLRSGLPIPAIINRKDGTSRSAHVSEIVLAGWMVRNSNLREQVLSEFKIYQKDNSYRTNGLLRALDLIDRADDSMKRSIQVAEWFTILSDDAVSSKTSSLEREAGKNLPCKENLETFLEPGLISDEEIQSLLFPESGNKPTLRIVPLISREAQVKGTVVDLRLGHNFEIFQNVGQIAIDVCDLQADDRVSSLVKEVDFLDGLPILPGQFILGHTLEYMRLPANLAAQIEGRSSFARLGIQVHMTANLVEAGFEGCLTLEILNSGPSTVVLYPGMRLAQLRFFRISGKTKASYSRDGNKYHGQLGHNRTKQFADPEVAIFRKHKANQKNEY